MKTIERKKLVTSRQRNIAPVPAAKKCSADKPASLGAATPLRLKSLLVPVDFSECSLKALDYANDLAKRSGGTVELLHVLEPAGIPHGLKMPHADWEDLMTQNAFNNLKQLAQDKIDEIIPVHTEVRIGSGYREICAAASRHGEDLIVIGTHGHTGLKHLFLGSTAERVVRYAPCSVLVVRGLDTTTSGTLKPGKILVPVDFSENSRQAVRMAIDLAKQFEAVLTLVYVVPTHYAVGEFDYLDYAMWESQLKEFAQKELSAIAKQIGANGVAVETQILHGRPATQIIEAAKKYQAGLIVISTHGRTGLEHVLLGSTTEDVVRHAHCPVLTFREGQRSDRL